MRPRTSCAAFGCANGAPYGNASPIGNADDAEAAAEDPVRPLARHFERAPLYWLLAIALLHAPWRTLGAVAFVLVLLAALLVCVVFVGLRNAQRNRADRRPLRFPLFPRRGAR